MKTNIDLVAYCKVQLGRPYWFGCVGQFSSVELYRAKKSQYGAKMTGSEKSYLEQAAQHVKVHDCSGLIKGFMMSDSPDAPAKYTPTYDLSSGDMIKACVQQGAISTRPEIPGLLLWKPNHVGVYIGGGKAIEAKGHAYGVIQTDNTAWQKWGKLPWIEYVNPAQKLCDIQLPELRKGSKCPEVRRVQLILRYFGYKDAEGVELAVDSSFGSKTEYALIKYQRDHNIPATGICNAETWIQLLTN